MALINVGGYEEDIEQLKSDVSELKTAVNTQQNSISTLNSQMTTATSNISNVQNSVSTLNSQMAVANSNISGNQSDITNLNTRVTNCENNINNLTTQQTATTANVNLLQSDVQNFAIDLLQNTGDINTLNTNYTALEVRVSALEDDPGGGGSSVPEYLIKSTIPPFSDVFFSGSQGSNEKILLRFFNPLPNDPLNKMQAVVVKNSVEPDVKIFSRTHCFFGYREGYKAFRVIKNNSIITGEKLFNENALYYVENYTEANDNGVWGFGLNLPGNINRVGISESDNNTLCYFYEDGNSVTVGTYTATVVGETITIEKDGNIIGSTNIYEFLYHPNGDYPYFVFPEFDENCTFTFEIQGQPLSAILMIHGILLEDKVENYGRWGFVFDVNNMMMRVDTPDGDSNVLNINGRNPDIWYNCGNYRFAFMLRYDSEHPLVDFDFNFNGVNTQYYDGTQAISRMGGSGDLYAYYSQGTGNITGSSAYFSSQNMTLGFQGNTEPVTEFTEIINSLPVTMFWTEKINKNTDTTFIF